MVEVKESGSVPVAPTPQPQRRPRVREVSSRFMSPLVSPAAAAVAAATATSSSDHNHHHHHYQNLPIRARSPLQKPVPPTPSDFQSRHRRSNSVQRQRSSDQETDENKPEINVFRSSETLTGAHSRVSVKLFKERGGETPRRVDTPTVTSTLLRSRKTNSCNLASAGESAAARLLHFNGLSNGGSRGGGGGGGASHRDPSPKSSPVKSRSVDKSDSREVSNSTSSSTSSSDDSETTVNGGDCLRPGASPLSRSLTLPFSSGNGRSIFDSVRANEKSASLSLKGSNAVKGGGCLPPMPPPLASSKVGPADAKKGGRKGLSQQDDMYRLKMLQNHYLQWRFTNAKAEASMISQKRECETTLYSLGVKLTELQESVQRKRDEVRQLRQAKALSTILEAQMPYLDDWSHLEGDYSPALLETTQCLLNVSSQLPLAGNTRADARELSEALNSAAKAMDLIFAQVCTFFPQAEEVGSLASEVAGVFSGEQALIQECRDLMSRANASQVVECCLRSQLMQIHQLNRLACPNLE